MYLCSTPCAALGVIPPSLFIYPPRPSKGIHNNNKGIHEEEHLSLNKRETVTNRRNIILKTIRCPRDGYIRSRDNTHTPYMVTCNQSEVEVTGSVPGPSENTQIPLALSDWCLEKCLVLMV